MDLTPDNIEFFREAGASEEFLTLIQVSPDDVNRNPVRREARCYVSHTDLDGDPEDFPPEGSRFLRNVWDGDLYDAYRQGDFVTATLLTTVFGKDRLNSARPRPELPTVEELGSTPFIVSEPRPQPDARENFI
ncbi:hypothetical protein [Halorarum salinum]|uniref:Uncharacterized protein n=1 Tax=Halorarum salinum TaxID=2743089 RepID=A0A7D5QA03_9EURY|nr:hypothetical protein [Halobaculum salinum]QLG60500.1 hypothetical protein HUG12_01540 [Halobaculum salinum]